MKIACSLLFSVSLACCALSQTPAPQHPHRGVITRPTVGGVTEPPPVETPTTLTFFENQDTTGASYTVQLKPPVSFQATRIIPTSELSGAGLAGKASVVRLVCGTRPSRASLFTTDWSQFASGTMIECTPGQQTDINLAAQPLSIYAAALVVHVRTSDNKTHQVVFSTLFSAVWKTQVQNLGSGATAQWTKVWLDDFQDIHVEQALQLDSTWCTARGAVFEIRINVSASNFKPVFKVYGISQYVDYGFGDAWGCHDGMMKALSSGIGSASAKLEAGLPQLVLGSSSSPVFYFAPEDSTKNYDLFFWQ